MATIKDVAKLAGVSHGTVSNVLKGVSSVSLENVKRVEEAIHTLGFRPDAAARSLKGSNMQGVGVVLPNITDSLYSQLYTIVEDICYSRGFELELFITQEIADKETHILSHIQSLKLAGLIIVSCQPDNSQLFSHLLDDGLKIVFVERAIQGLDCNFVGFRNDKSIHYAVTTMIAEDHDRIALIAGPGEYSCERLCEDGYRLAIAEAGREVDENYLRYTNYSNEGGFKAAMNLLGMPEPPEVIICTSTQLVSGVLGAIKLACNGRQPQIISLGEEQWNDNRYPGVKILPRSNMLMGETVANLLFDNMHDPAFFEYRNIQLNNIRVNIEREAAFHAPAHTADIRVSMIEGGMADAVCSLLPDLRHKHGINVELSIFAHEELYEHILEHSEKSDFDVFLVDVLWLREFAAKGLLADLTPHMDEDFMDVIDIQPEFFDDFACCNSSVYAIPYQYSNQLLYYRKDLFDNMKNRRMFYEQYKVELKCPQTWSEYNAIARFFTREFNPESETVYGTTLGGRYSSAALCEFLPRLWAYGTDVFDRHGRVAIDSPDAVKALNNYCESFRYASPGSPNHWWHEQVSEFASGDVAMMILYSSYVSPLVDASVSKVVGKVAFASIPGARPVLGGWSFAINHRSKSQSAALQFIKWACSKDIAIPSTLLGNLSACRSIYNSAEVKSIYPWIAKSLEIYPDSMRRALPKEKAVVGIKRYEEIIAEAVHESILGNIAPIEAIKKAAEELTALLNANT